MPENQPATSMSGNGSSVKGRRSVRPLTHKPHRLALGGGALAVLGILAIALVHHFWPFTQDQIATALQDTFRGKVTFQTFHATYFPHPGCVADGVVFDRASRNPNTPAFATVQRLTIQAHYLDILLRPGVIALIRLDGLHLEVPSRGSIPEGAPPTQESSSTRIGKVVADGTILDVARGDGEPPLRFEIHSATLNSLTNDGQLSYKVAFHNPLPPGEIQSTGEFGPWNSADPGQTRVVGKYTFEHADLGVFPGIAGTMSSQDDFRGVLEHIEAHGTVDVPDFQVTSGGHPVPLHSRFQAVVNGTNGDVFLEKVDSTLLRTVIGTTGRIAGTQQRQGKTVSLAFTVNQGRIQDFLRLFVHGSAAPYNGITDLTARVTVPPDGKPFLQELQIDGDFGIAGGHFTQEDTQTKIASLSERARGQKPDDVPVGNTDDVISNLRGHVSLRNATATLTDFYFEVPGAKAKMHGTYGLIDRRLDFHGMLGTDVKVSQTTSGFKSAILKPFDGLFKGKHHPGVVPVKLVGTYSQPEAGLDMVGKLPK
jgi:AsmA-like C-terminal region